MGAAEGCVLPFEISSTSAASVRSPVSLVKRVVKASRQCLQRMPPSVGFIINFCYDVCYESSLAIPSNDNSPSYH